MQVHSTLLEKVKKSFVKFLLSVNLTCFMSKDNVGPIFKEYVNSCSIFQYVWHYASLYIYIFFFKVSYVEILPVTTLPVTD